MAPQHVLDVPRRDLVPEREQVADRPQRLVRRRADGGGRVGEDDVEVDEDAALPPPGERGREVRGDERRAGASARPGDREHRRRAADRELLRRPDLRGGLGERIAFGRPQEEPGRARADRAAKRRDRLRRVEREQRAPVELAPRRGERRRRHDPVGLELADGLGELARVGRRADHPRDAAAVEEVKDLLRDLRLLERQHDPRDLLHRRSCAPWGSTTTVVRGRGPRGERRGRRLRGGVRGGQSPDRPIRIAKLPRRDGDAGIGRMGWNQIAQAEPRREGGRGRRDQEVRGAGRIPHALTRPATPEPKGRDRLVAALGARAGGRATQRAWRSIRWWHRHDFRAGGRRMGRHALLAASRGGGTISRSMASRIGSLAVGSVARSTRFQADEGPRRNDRKPPC